MKTVLYDHQIFNIQKLGGISRYFCEIASRVQKSPEWRSRVLAPLYINRHLAESDISAHGIFLPSSRLERLRNTVNRWALPTLSLLSTYDILHQTYYCATTPPISYARKVVTVFDMMHEKFPQYFPRNDPTVASKRIALESADHVVCISHQTANDLVSIYGIPPERVTVTHLGYSPIFDDLKRVEPALPADAVRPYFLYVGHRSGYKNFARVLAAFASSKTLASKFDLVAFGGDRFSPDELATISGLGVRPDSIRHQSGNDVALARAYRHARAFVYPSEYEGFGIPPLEAMASDCAVACSNTSAIPEVVADAGQYFDPLQIDAIRSALETLAFDDARHKELIDAGRLRCKQFSWNRCAAQTLAAYETALGTPRT